VYHPVRRAKKQQLDEMKKVFYELNRMHEESLVDVTAKNFELNETIDDFPWLVGRMMTWSTQQSTKI
jgi:hypothetical protein